MKLVESVPNFSEGRRLDVVDRLAAAVTDTPGAYLLDRTSDASHNRSVLTLAGAVRAGVRGDGPGRRDGDRADRHGAPAGEHPRIGAVDVIPFVPLGDSTMEECVALARRFGRQIADTYGLPVYLYAQAATRPDREKLSDIRRGQYEGLRDAIREPGREPDFGPTRTHPTAGAVAVGARPFLIAYNINLDSPDLELAKRIARRIRESGGGLPRVQANGFWIEELGRAQVSMNLLDFAITPIWRVWEPCEAEAAGDDVSARRVGADRAGAAGGVPGRRRPHRIARGRRRRGSACRCRALPPLARFLAAAGARAAARGSTLGDMMTR